jgi:hypothetical protein
MKTSIVVIVTIAVCIWAHAAFKCVNHFVDLMENRMATIAMTSK